jgi:hypothetical protein
VIDWILTEKIAAYVAGRGDAPAPKADLTALAAESERRVRAYTKLEPVRALPPPEGIGRPEWTPSWSGRGAGSGRCGRPSSWGSGW